MFQMCMKTIEMFEYLAYHRDMGNMDAVISITLLLAVVSLSMLIVILDKGKY